MSGPIVEEFRRIQREHGDDAAFDYFDAEADGLHVTPYGFCLNSFTVDPCPKHLECFNGCGHLTRSDVPEERQNLESLRDRTKRAIAKIETSPPGSIWPREPTAPCPGAPGQYRESPGRRAGLSTVPRWTGPLQGDGGQTRQHGFRYQQEGSR